MIKFHSLVLLTLLLLCAPLIGQNEPSSQSDTYRLSGEQLVSHVIAGGATEGQSTNYRVTATVAQASTGYGSSPGYGVSHGFWAEYPGSCCGQYTGGITGNTNCSSDGKLTLSDITALIDHVYISKSPLCCAASGNTNGSTDCKITLSDITRLIDAIYISKAPSENCLPACET